MPQSKTAEYWMNFVKDRPGLAATLWEAMERFQDKEPNRYFGWDFTKKGFNPIGYWLTEEN